MNSQAAFSSKSARSLLFSGASYVMSVVFILGSLLTTPSMALAQATTPNPPPKKSSPQRAEPYFHSKPAEYSPSANYSQKNSNPAKAQAPKLEPMKKQPSQPYVSSSMEEAKKAAIEAANAKRPSKPIDRNKPIKFYEFRDPDTREKVVFMYQPSTRAELLKYAPSKSRLEEQRPPNPNPGFVKSSVKLAKDFPAEFIAFTTAMMLSGMIHTDNDPLFAKNFVDANTSPEGVVSFAGFVAANRATYATLQAFGVAYDPQRAPLNYRLETPFRPVTVTTTEYFNAEPKTSPNNTPNYRAGSVPPTTSTQNGGATVPNRNGDTRARREKPADFTKARVNMSPDYLNSKYVGRPTGPTRFQRNFSPLLGPIGMSAGMIVSNVIHEALADDNLRLCAKGLPKSKDEESLKQAQALKEEACDKAWHDWVSTDKIKSYTPDLLAMSAASLIHAYIVNKAIIGTAVKASQKGAAAAIKSLGVGLTTGASGIEGVALREGAEKVIPIVLRGVRVAGAVGGFVSGPWGRFAMTVGNLWIFMEIVHPITPLIKKPWERSTQGGDITARINTIFTELDRAEKNKWVWTPRTDLGACVTFDPVMLELPNQTPANCIMIEPEQHNPGVLLKQMAERQLKWRGFLLQDAYMAHGSWQTYVSKFGTMYANATAFYAQVVRHINYHNFDPAVKNEESYLYVDRPIYGLYTDKEKRDSATALDAIKNAREWLEKYMADLNTTRPSYRPEFKQLLPEILTGLRAADLEYPFASLKAPEASFRNLNAMSEDERREFEGTVRTRLVANAVRVLKTTLLSHPKYNDKGISFSGTTYRMRAGDNPFMQLRILLGDPQPLPKGVGFIRDSNDDESLIVQQTKEDFPASVGIFHAETMTDYLALSMVCGPEADPKFSDAQKVQIYKERKLSFFERTLDTLGLARQSVQANDPNVMIAVNEFTEESTGRSESRLPFFGKNNLLTVWKSFKASFRPPRIVSGVPEDVCRRPPKGDRSQTSLLNPHLTKWTIDGKNYEGILDIVRNKVRPEVVGTTAYPKDRSEFVAPFETWWTAKVDKHIIPMVENLRGEYRDILKEKYIPALTNKEQTTYNGRVVRLGALASLYDEAYLYLLILGKTSAVSKDAAASKEWQALSKTTLQSFQNLGTLATDLNYVESKGEVAQAAFDEKRETLSGSLKTLKAFVEKRQTSVNATPDMVAVNTQALKNLDGLMGETDSYWGIVRGIQVSGQ